MNIGVYGGLIAARCMMILRTAGRRVGGSAEVMVAVVAVWASGFMLLVVLLIRARPPVKALAGYCRSVLKAGFQVETALLYRQAAAGPASLGQLPVLKREYQPLYARLPSGKQGLLNDSRVRRLQGVIIGRLFQSLFGIAPDNRDRGVLQTFSSASWLCRSMITAAGTAVDRDDYLRRCKVVFPVFMKAMRLHRAWLKAGGGTSLRLRLRGRTARKYRGIGPKGEVTGCLYPDIVTRQEIAMRGERDALLAGSRRFYTRTAAQTSLGRCAAAAVLLTAKTCPYDPAKAGRILRSQRAVHNLILRRKPWETGQRMRMTEHTKL